MVNASSRHVSRSPRRLSSEEQISVQTQQYVMHHSMQPPLTIDQEYNQVLASFLARQEPFTQSDSLLDPSGSHRFQVRTPATSQGGFHATSTSNRDTRPRQALNQHRVYVIRCMHCQSFVSDRGMRAVLLLRPHISLFSTDAPPVRCGPLYSSMDEPTITDEEFVERTCDCLTQSLGCYTCGNVIGYHIISPCSKCTASVSRQQRSANGHRYVFHHNEVTFSERKCSSREERSRAFVRESVKLDSHRRTEASHALSANNAIETKDAVPSGHNLNTPPSMLSRASTPDCLTAGPHSDFLREGDTVYWHHLPTAGEIGQPYDTGAATPAIYCVGR